MLSHNELSQENNKTDHFVDYGRFSLKRLNKLVVIEFSNYIFASVDSES